MTFTSARLGVSVIGQAIIGTSDMPDITAEHFTWEGRCWELVSDPDLGTALMEPDGNRTAQRELTARMASIMDLATKKLIVTDEAILNHATLIGKTVVDDINVNGTLIGQDGVFTGTVDFANVNVTGEALIEKLAATGISADLIEGGHFSGESFEGGTFTGGLFKTSDALPGRVSFSDNAYQGNRPGLSIEPASTAGLATMPGIGPDGNGMGIHGGLGTDGGYGFAAIKRDIVAIGVYNTGNAARKASLAAWGENAKMSAETSDTIGSAVSATPSQTLIRTRAGASGESLVATRAENAFVRTVREGGSTAANIEAQANWVFFNTKRADGSIKSEMAAGETVSYLKTVATDGARGEVGAQTSLAHLTAYDSTNYALSTLRADGRTAWMRANATNGDSSFIQASPTGALIKAESGAGTRLVESNATAARLYAQASSGNRSYVEARTGDIAIRRVTSDGRISCAADLGGNSVVLYTSNSNNVLQSRLTVDSTGTTVDQGAFRVNSNMSLDGNLYYYTSGTSSREANVTMPVGGGFLARSTSSRRYKRNIADWNPEAERVLALRPRQWQHNDPNSEIDERWHVGFIAEEVDELGLKGLVEYAGDGRGGWRPEALNYSRFAAAQQVVLQKHEQEIQDLRSENDELRSRLDRLEALLTQENA